MNDEGLMILAPLIGTWEGQGEGRPGTSNVRRTYRWVLRGTFIEVKSASSYPPQAANPDGEEHEEFGYFSFDRSRRKVVFRVFHIEGFVNQYLLQPHDATTLVFDSEAIENIPTGYTARETLHLTAPGRLEEVFELAGPGQPLAEYTRNRLFLID
jgi:hypothetical protein